jgi:hypothetical protein
LTAKIHALGIRQAGSPTAVTLMGLGSETTVKVPLGLAMVLGLAVVVMGRKRGKEQGVTSRRPLSSAG